MSNLLSMLYTGVSGLATSQAQLSVTGHNIANVKNPDFTRQRVVIGSAYTTKEKDGAFGYGSKVQKVERVYDELLAKTLRNEKSTLAYWSRTQMTMSEVQIYFNELETGSGLGESMKAYFNAWQDLSNTAPDNTDESYIKRTQVLNTATVLATEFQKNRTALTDIQRDIDIRMKSCVDEINNISESIADLNKRIASVEVSGQNANDMRDARDALVNKLGEFMNVSTIERKDGSIAVLVAGQSIVDSDDHYDIDLRAREGRDNGYDVVWTTGIRGDKGVVITDKITSGVLCSEIEMRDKLIAGYIDELDDLAETLITETNKIHALGQGLERFDRITSSNAVVNPGYVLNSVEGFLPHAVQKGTFQIKVYDSEGNVASTHNISIDPAKENLNGIIEKITTSGLGAEGGLEAVVNEDGTISMSVGDGFSFAFTDDTSGFLVASGFNNFFSGTDASNIEVDSLIANNIKYIAASKSGPPGDNQNALALVDLKFTKLASNNGITIDEFYSFFSGQLASDKQQVDIFVTTKQMSVDEYSERFQSITGVSMEEEEINLAMFQRTFEANSRYINAVDEMLNLVVNNLGLVGR